MNNNELKKRFYDYLRQNKIWWSPERLNYSLGLHFRGLQIDGKRILEIGAGHGLFSVWCASNGAKEIVAIEPEGAGSTSGVNKFFKECSNAIGLSEQVKHMAMTLDEFNNVYSGRSFDYILMHAVINHLDEAASMRLHLRDALNERERFVGIFKKLDQLLKPEGTIIISDVGRKNFWNDLKLPCVFCKTIEWHKHQQPQVWKKLLEESGFSKFDLTWYPNFRLRKLKFFLSWWLPSYLTDSAFILRCFKSVDQ